MVKWLIDKVFMSAIFNVNPSVIGTFDTCMERLNSPLQLRERGNR